MQAGKLDKRVTISKRVEVVDAFGQERNDYERVQWDDVATVWARVQPLSGREFMELRQQAADITVRITIRYRAGIEPSMRVAWKQHWYDIDSVIHIDEGQRELQLMCRERVADG